MCARTIYSVISNPIMYILLCFRLNIYLPHLLALIHPFLSLLQYTLMHLH